ncbi:MAG: serine/threonine-protein kinase [Planctomycetota bacterium]|nr:serine/threonine-protein kinase [Planctomycetota bacterium]
MTKIDQLFLKTALKMNFIEESDLNRIAASIEKGEEDAASIAVEASILTQEQASRIMTAIESRIPPEGIPGFDVLSPIGRGATSTVWKARQESLGKIVALKVFSAAITSTSSPEQLIEEARNAARLNHPNIVHAIDAGISDGMCWFAMELVEGETLHQKLKRRGALSEREMGELALSITQGLAHAHSAGLLHRDMKPDNILISGDGVPKITDLGLALAEAEAGKLDSSEIRKGTPHYISPEQARGDDIDGRSDLYSLGATLYHCMTGRPPFQGTTNREILMKHVQEEVIPVATLTGKESKLDAVIEKLLSKEPSQRYHDADQVIQALTEALDVPDTEARSAPRGRKRSTGTRAPGKRVIAGASQASLHSRNTLMTKIGIGVGLTISVLMVITAASKANEPQPGFEEVLAKERSDISAMKIKSRMNDDRRDHERRELAADSILKSIMGQDQDLQIRALKHALESHGGTSASAQMSVAIDAVKGSIVEARQADGRSSLEQAKTLASDGKLWTAIMLLDDRPASARRDQDLNDEIEKLLSNWEEEIDSRFEADFQKVGFHRDRREFAEALAVIDAIELYADPDNANEAVKLRDGIIMARETLANEEAKRRLNEESSRYLQLWPEYRIKALDRDIKGMVSIAVALDIELVVEEVKSRVETDLLAFQLLDHFIKEAMLELVEKGEDGKEVVLERKPLEGSSRTRKDRGVVDRIDSDHVWLRLSAERAVMPFKIVEITDVFLFDQVAQRHGRNSTEYRIPLGVLSIYRGLDDVATENFRIAEQKGTRPDTWIQLHEWVKKFVPGR